MDNQTIAKKLSDHARHLEKEGNLYRVRAYRQAAQTIRALEAPVTELLKQQGIKGLERLPGIGSHLSFAIERLATTGQFYALAEDAASIPPHERIENLPGVGPKLAELLWERLGIHSVSELARAVHETQFAELPIGEKRRQRLIATVEEKQCKEAAPLPNEPAVAELLAVDDEYRRQAAQDRLVKIAPTTAGPTEWLPLLSLRRHGWRYRVLPYRRGKAGDAVIIYFDNGRHKGERIVATEEHGELRGQRVVRGREAECGVHYRMGCSAVAAV